MTLPDIPRLYTALAEWCACMVYILAVPRRLRGWRLAACSGGILAALTAFLMLTGDLSIGFWLPCMAVAVGMMYLLLAVCCQISLRDAGYYCIQAFVLAEFAASLEWQLYCFLLLNRDHSFWSRAALLLVVYAGVYLLAGYLVRRLYAKMPVLGATWRELGSAAIIGLAVFALSNLSFLSIRTPFSGQYGPDMFNIRTIMDLGGLAILYAHHLQCRELRVSRELESMENVLHKQYQQYQLSKESIDLINRKYHDLKHQIAVLRAQPDAVQREAYLTQMESEIKTYEAQNKTGNQVLDTVLTSKSLYCAQHGITLTCVADGALLNFMDVMDLSAVFGNALDNAIECEERIADPEKRLIHVSVSAQRGFVLIRFENYCEDAPSFSEGLPVTTKEDRNYHGYGLKSIRYVAKKYGGTVTVRMEKQWFVLQLLFPRSKEGTPG